MNQINTIIPIYNCEKTIERAVLSVLEQKNVPENWNNDVICVFNKCTDNSFNIVKEINNSHPKKLNLFMIFCDEKGIVPTLNTGIRYCLNENFYVARQDGDDVWKPNKLEKQIKFFAANPDIDILGTNINLVNPADPNDIISTTNYPTEHFEIKKWLVSAKNPIAHPSVMFKSRIFKRAGTYDDLFPVAEDLWLWQKASMFYKFANLSDVLVDYASKHNPNYSHKVPQMASFIHNQILSLNKNLKIIS